MLHNLGIHVLHPRLRVHLHMHHNLHIVHGEMRACYRRIWSEQGKSGMDIPLQTEMAAALAVDSLVFWDDPWDTKYGTQSTGPVWDKHGLQCKLHLSINSYFSSGAQSGTQRTERHRAHGKRGTGRTLPDTAMHAAHPNHHSFCSNSA